MFRAKLIDDEDDDFEFVDSYYPDTAAEKLVESYHDYNPEDCGPFEVVVTDEDGGNEQRFEVIVEHVATFQAYSLS